jgi:SAM-dependent methyltransferase
MNVTSYTDTSSTIDQKCSAASSFVDGDAGNEADRVVFYDLGSGVGRLVTQIYMENYRVKRAVGVELSLERHTIAIEALTEILESFNDYGTLSRYQNINDDYECFVGSMVSAIPSAIEFVHGDALEVDFTDATHLFMSSLCFPQEVLMILQERILHLPRIEVVAALNRLELFWLRKEEWNEREISIQMTWGPSTAKIYSRTHS